MVVIQHDTIQRYQGQSFLEKEHGLSELGA
jgi:hypothetical protein